MRGERRSVVVAGHPNVVTHNQLVYVRLEELGWDVRIVLPNRWVDEYSPGGFQPVAIEGFRGRFVRARIARPGVIQRHVYVPDPARWLRDPRPDVLFLENEPFGVPTLQWGFAARRLRIPWGVQGDENVDRPLPWPARAIRAYTTPRIDFFAARSPGGEAMLRQWGARGEIGIVPHTLPEWEAPLRPAGGEPFTIGFAGRLVEAKGVHDLLAAVALLDFPFRLLVVGDGPRREAVRAADLGRGTLDLRTGVRSDDMPPLYAEMDVLVLPSRTTRTWAEQFGKVLGEALLCGTPVVGAASGEIPWVIETTGGGRVFPEGDVAALAAVLGELRADPNLRARLAATGRRGVVERLSPRVAAAELDRLMRGALARRAQER
ncbi:MAG: glycosyl transferase, group 1 family protein [Solirubrobacterales bacterium]|nr:glycosyl transferase, group 1 family protein [Solirubrobacterales bacterium]